MFVIKNKRTVHTIEKVGEEAIFETKEQAEIHIQKMVQFFKNEKMKAPWGKYAEMFDFEVIEEMMNENV